MNKIASLRAKNTIRRNKQKAPATFSVSPIFALKGLLNVLARSIICCSICPRFHAIVAISIFDRLYPIPRTLSDIRPCVFVQSVVGIRSVYAISIAAFAFLPVTEIKDFVHFTTTRFAPRMPPVFLLIICSRFRQSQNQRIYTPCCDKRLARTRNRHEYRELYRPPPQTGRGAIHRALWAFA